LESYDWKIERISMPDGRSGVVCYFYDLSERQRHEEHVKLLMQELNHRSKNMLSLIQAIARQTAAGGTESFLPKFEMRLRALAASQDLLLEHSWTSVPLNEVVRNQLAHLADALDERIMLEGPPLSLTPAAAQALGLALHELATNATKYGSLSRESGQVTIGWEIGMNGPEAPRFSIVWEERGGPPVTVPNRCGLGTSVMTRMVEMNLGGEVALDYPRSGLVWRLNCPAENVVEGDLTF
jgi:two-component sensor histidine kinase